MKKFRKLVIGAALIGALGYGFYDRKNIYYTLTNPISIYYALAKGIDIGLQRRLYDEEYDVSEKIGAFENFNSSDLYFLKNLSEIDYTSMINRKKLEDNLLERLSKKEHTYRKFEEYEIDLILNYDESSEQIKKCNIMQLLKLYVILNSLENKEICDKIGELVENDLKDNNHEHGGLVKLKDSKLAFIHYPSDKEENGVYSPPREHQKELDNGCFADYHFHAMEEDDTEYAGPSYQDLTYYNIERIINEGYLGIVITKLKDKNFNADICFINYTEEGSSLVIDLGNYSY